jgi:phosphomannomutase
VAFIKSISGFRGTLGGYPGDNLTPVDIVNSSSAFGSWLLDCGARPLVVIGRDARISGEIVSQLVAASLRALGIDVIDLGLATTPTVEMAVPYYQAGGGIILTASHNPREWNALKLLNEKGEFISAEAGARLLAIAESNRIKYASVDALGSYRYLPDEALQHHIAAVLAYPLVATEAIRKAGYTIVVDAVNSVGAMAIPALLEQLGCKAILLNGEMSGQFAHNPEPLPQHLTGLTEAVRDSHADLGLAVDPDVDRLALVGPGGTWIGEEYTLVAVADYVLKHRSGAVVSNLSSSRALADLAAGYGQPYFAAAVGEVNVVNRMKSVAAVIGGEGNGGIIVPDLHYGRDSLIGLALVLSALATGQQNINELRQAYPQYEMVKDKLELSADFKVEDALTRVMTYFASEKLNTEDGLKIDFAEGWVHLRRSNTEPIVRIYAEAKNAQAAAALVEKVRSIFVNH